MWVKKCIRCDEIKAGQRPCYDQNTYRVFYRPRSLYCSNYFAIYNRHIASSRYALEKSALKFFRHDLTLTSVQLTNKFHGTTAPSIAVNACQFRYLKGKSSNFCFPFSSDFFSCSCRL